MEHNSRANFGLKYITPYHPQISPAQRFMREIGCLARTYNHANHSGWTKHLPDMENWLNITYHESTGMTPYELMFQRLPDRILEEEITFPDRQPYEYEERIELARERLRGQAAKRKERHDNKSRGVTCRVGDLVLFKTHVKSSKLENRCKKFFLLFSGPYEIVEVKGENAYVLKDPKTNQIKGTYNIVELRGYKSKKIWLSEENTPASTSTAQSL